MGGKKKILWNYAKICYKVMTQSIFASCIYYYSKYSRQIVFDNRILHLKCPASCHIIWNVVPIIKELWVTIDLLMSIVKSFQIFETIELVSSLLKKDEVDEILGDSAFHACPAHGTETLHRERWWRVTMSLQTGGQELITKTRHCTCPSASLGRSASRRQYEWNSCLQPSVFSVSLHLCSKM